ncbi:MAG: glycosyltransferase [Lachnospiraceae bacterium]|nr:glycosyltransferase [Lachnospiraceae bacterium]
MDRTAIVVIAYNRPQSLLRLLDSLTNAYYPDGVDVPLIISVDKSDSTETEDVANDYVWEHGEKSVRLHETNLGLKEHVLECGDISREYEGIIMLEDDLYVSPSFFMYSHAAMNRVRLDKRVGGISLYSHRLNVHAREPFEAIDDGYDNYYLQFASSWGQAFSTEQWEAFREWYEIHKDDEIAGDNVPLNVSSWSEKSWLKYFIKFLIDTDRYFIYPRVSFTTNFGDEGTHASAGVNDLQVPIAGMRRYGQIDFHFSDTEESRAKYDAYFENMCLDSRLPEAAKGDTSVDMYGTKQNGGYKRYVLSCRSLPYRALQTYGRNLRPIDANVMYKIEGRDFFLYDTQKPGKAPEVNDVEKYLYNYRAIKAKEMLTVLKYRIKMKLPFGKPKVKPVKTVRTSGEKAIAAGENATENIENAEAAVMNVAGEYAAEYNNAVVTDGENMGGSMPDDATDYIQTA